MNIIELRDNSIVLIKARKRKSFIEVQNHLTIDLPDGYKSLMTDSNLMSEVHHAIRHFYSQDRDCLLCLSITSLIYRDILTPKTNKKYLKSLVKHELVNALNLSSDYLIDYAQVGEITLENVKQSKLLISAIQTNLLTEILNFFEKCGLNIKKIDVSNHGLIRFSRHTQFIQPIINTVIVDISSKQIRQFLFESGQFSYHRVTKVNLDNDTSNNYMLVLDAIEKMIQFSIAQGRIKTVDQIQFIGFPLDHDSLDQFNQDLNIEVKLIDFTKSIHFKTEADPQLLYALSMLYKPDKFKSIDLMSLYLEINKKHDFIERINPLFSPTLAILTYFILTTLIILVIKTNNANQTINEINAYLSQESVSSKMAEINVSTNNTNKMNEILTELNHIQNVLNKIPRYNQEMIQTILNVTSESISIQEIRYSSNLIEIDIETLDSSLIYQYVILLKNENYFKDVTYSKYERDEQSGIYKSTISLSLKELE